VAGLVAVAVCVLTAIAVGAAYTQRAVESPTTATARSVPPGPPAPVPATTRPELIPLPESSAPSPAPRAPNAKKGVSSWYFDGFTEALDDVNASWYYNWASGRGRQTAPKGVEFVPMMWGADSVKKAALDEAKRQGKVLLGFNEPDRDDQADMTVEEALDLWPQLLGTGMRLGSPAPATGAPKKGSWLDRFMDGAARRGYRVDFVAVHWYGSDFGKDATGHLRSYLQDTYARYHKPIWLTEFALINFTGEPKFPTQAQQAAFVRSSTAMLEELPFVERYAWFALPATEGSGTGLYRDGDSPTTVGAAYRAAVADRTAARQTDRRDRSGGGDGGDSPSDGGPPGDAPPGDAPPDDGLPGDGPPGDGGPGGGDGYGDATGRRDEPER
jgi:hypothetical protein